MQHAGELTMKENKIIFQVDAISKEFSAQRTFREIVTGTKKRVLALDRVSFEIKENEIFALVGESGCGKTTLARIMMKLISPTRGRFYFQGRDVTHINKQEEKKYRLKVQMIFQDPYASMNPRFRTRDVLEEPLVIHRFEKNKKARTRIIHDALSDVRLLPPGEYMTRFPHMLSGGQRQRVSIARARLLSPVLIVADEPVSMIDLSTRAEILFLMKQVQQKTGMSYLYITHDLSTARYFADRIGVMYLGTIVESGNVDEVISNPCHPYTKALIASVCEPVPGKVDSIKEIPLKGEIPPSTHIPGGCRFHPRCLYALPRCMEEEPPAVEVNPDHLVACHLFP
ncbi:MAG: ABC transporter ATP-binding protein [Spirochaetales bacterium]|nr:ABC transporter ATP-binding protein [Spirochaetales bacterium]